MGAGWWWWVVLGGGGGGSSSEMFVLVGRGGRLAVRGRVVVLVP